MTANNEIGTIEPVDALGALCRERGVLFHTDAVQSAGKFPIDVKRMPVDMLAISGHKIYAPKGIGVLFIRRGVRLHALIHGGVHERGRRAGTENVTGAVGLGAACVLAGREIPVEEPRVRALRDKLENGILDRVPGVRVNGHPMERIGNTSNLSFEAVEGETLVLALDQAGFILRRPELPGFEVSTGAACSAGLLDPSHVLAAIGAPPWAIRGGVRFSLGRTTTEPEIDAALEAIPAVVERLRALSPVWEDKGKGSILGGA